MSEKDEKMLKKILNSIKNMSQEELDERNERTREHLKIREQNGETNWLTVEIYDKLKKEAKRVNEKDGKIILDKNDPSDIDWWNEDDQDF